MEETLTLTQKVSAEKSSGTIEDLFAPYNVFPETISGMLIYKEVSAAGDGGRRSPLTLTLLHISLSSWLQ